MEMSLDLFCLILIFRDLLVDVLQIFLGRDTIYREIFGVVISFQKAFGRELIFRDSLVDMSPQKKMVEHFSSEFFG